MAVTSDPETWKEGQVARFHKLHYDTIRRVRLESISTPHGTEEVGTYEVDGKARPCLILDYEDPFFRVWWCARPRDGRESRQVRCPGTQERPFSFRLGHSWVDWVHIKLAVPTGH